MEKTDTETGRASAGGIPQEMRNGIMIEGGFNSRQALEAFFTAAGQSSTPASIVSRRLPLFLGQRPFLPALFPWFRRYLSRTIVKRSKDFPAPGR
ncbi:MAG: hypothetical protein PHE27_07330 [Alphaproteobacteria bacterium]|nr:hypothetical protein [Alphaproteobacteria bacterium]